MPKKIKRIIPSMYELWYVILTSAALLVAGCTRVFLQRYDLIGSSQAVHAEFSNALGTGLGKLDSLSFTANVITFIVWGGIGLAILSLIHAITQASNTWKFERELSSNRYVHPANFDRKTYWQNIARSTVLSFVLVTLFLVGGLLYFLYVIPVGFYFTQRFLIHSSVAGLWTLGTGILTIFLGTFVVYILLKAIIWHHHTSLH